MDENIYLCQECRNVFKLPMPTGSPPEEGTKCPRCGSQRTEELPSWIPLGSNLSESPSVWEYECQQCRKTFKLPIPTPTQEKEITCPGCGGRHIHRLTASGVEPLYCG